MITEGRDRTRTAAPRPGVRTAVRRRCQDARVRKALRRIVYGDTAYD
jgi:hypothetical protein